MRGMRKREKGRTRHRDRRRVEVAGWGRQRAVTKGERLSEVGQRQTKALSTKGCQSAAQAWDSRKINAEERAQRR